MTLTAERPPEIDRRAAAKPRRPSQVWWLSPVAITALLVPLAVIPTMFISDASFRLQWNTPKTITVDQCMLLLAGGLSLTLAAAVVLQMRPLAPRRGSWPDFTEAESRLLTKTSRVLFTLTIIGYLAFFYAGYRAGISLSQVLTAISEGSVVDGTIKKDVGTIPGVTTLTQVGIASAVVSALLLAHKRSWREYTQLGVIFMFALLRAFLLTERLAILELAVPITVVAALRAARTPRGQRIMRWAPLAMLPVLLTVFTFFEYTRSWLYYRTKSDASLLQFAVERLIGYYATSLNNGALELVYNRYPGRLPYETLAAFWSAPGISNMDLYKSLTGADNAEVFLTILQTYGSPEFNNSSGIAQPFIDLGTVGGLIYLLAAGAIIGMLYRGFRETRAAGLLIYPVLFLAIVELPRYMGWTQGRNTPAYLALIVVAVLLHRAGRKASA